MTEPIFDTEYWKNRDHDAHRIARTPHFAVFRCGIDQWNAIEAKHHEILKGKIGLHNSVLDVGCGYGRLLRLMPRPWYGAYLGVDLSPAFIERAMKNEPSRLFVVRDARHECLQAACYAMVYDWAVMISIRPMVIRNAGQEEWDKMEANVRKYARKLLYLEYDPEDEGSVE